MDAAAEATLLQRKLAKEADDKAGPDLESKGVKVNKLDPAAFAKATESVDEQIYVRSTRRVFQEGGPGSPG
jgi:TRAP-type C4-dicarboxylate transport system substrate-binding protein